jgi:hypothetical protein
VRIRSPLGERRVEQPVAGPLGSLPGHRGRDQRRARPRRRSPRQVALARLLAPGPCRHEQVFERCPELIAVRRGQVASVPKCDP